jgi:sugar (pentulose or hexulose) kinase
LKINNDFPQAVDNIVRVKDTFTPKDENARIYDRLFKEVYVKMYPALSPLHRKIAEITNYPKLR